MDRLKLYEELARHLDSGVAVGAPLSNSLIKILMLMFTPDQAEVALKLPFSNKSLDEIKEIFSDQADTIEETLEEMVKNGTVYTDNKSGQGKRFRLFPSVVGWAETPFWSGEKTEQNTQLAPLWREYREDGFGEELARNDMPVMRVVPVETSLKEESEILPFDVLKPIIDRTSFAAVGQCPCRLGATYIGDGCDHTTENCLHFGAMARFMVNQGMAKEITKEETLKIVKEADEEGLVHIIDNIDGHMSTICNCCSCCCAFITTRNKLGFNTLSESNYLAVVDAEECIACSNCEDRCPVSAIVLGEADVASVDEALCLGCGVCVPTCDSEAVALVKKSEIKLPPPANEFIAARLK